MTDLDTLRSLLEKAQAAGVVPNVRSVVWAQYFRAMSPSIIIPLLERLIERKESQVRPDEFRRVVDIFRTAYAEEVAVTIEPALVLPVFERVLKELEKRDE